MGRSEEHSTVPSPRGATPMPVRELLPHPASDPLGAQVERGLAVAASVLLVLTVLARIVGSPAAATLGVCLVVGACVLGAAWRGSLMAPVAALAVVAVTTGTADLHVGVRPGTLPPLPWLDGTALSADEQVVLCSSALAGCLAALAVLRRQRDIGRITPARGYALLAAAAGLGLVLVAGGVTGAERPPGGLSPDGSSGTAVAGLPPVPWPCLLLVVLAAFGPLDLSRDGRLAGPVVGACGLALAWLVGSLEGPAAGPGAGSAPAWTMASATAALGLVLLAGGVSVFALLGRRLRYGTE